MADGEYAVVEVPVLMVKQVTEGLFDDPDGDKTFPVVMIAGPLRSAVGVIADENHKVALLLTPKALAAVVEACLVQAGQRQGVYRAEVEDMFLRNVARLLVGDQVVRDGRAN